MNHFFKLILALFLASTTLLAQEKTDNLTEVVISASREKQQRNEVPSAISVIDSAKIAQTKAFGIDQLVNDTPGVYLSTSRGSSNEQHFTAVRSPISTKPLFLFLEDGLPIRPTAIFNHNALLELNTVSHQRVEILRGPNASIYGSDAIGGSFNFITKDPTKKLSGHVSFQANELGYSGVGFDIGKQVTDKFGIYIASQFNQRNNGPFEHSDYDKYALKVKTVFKPFDHSKLTVMYSGSDFLTDMAGSVGEINYRTRNFQSNQTFTNRDAVAHRIRATWEQKWDNNNKTSFSAIYRDNVMKQNPSFRISQFRDPVTRQLTGAGSGRVNSNDFNSIFGNVQHQIKFPSINASLIAGGSFDLTKQDFVSNSTSITVDPLTRKNIDFEVLPNDFILNYDADIFNYAGYTQFEISPIEQLKITTGLRFDYFEYDAKNNDVKGFEDRVNIWRNWAPKVGVNYNFSKKSGIYGNVSTGFTPPQSSTLYRNISETNVNGDLKPSDYISYELGTYLTPIKNLKLDIALYKLDGRNTLVSVRNEDVNNTNSNAFFTTNAGKTSSYGIEYGVSFKPNSLIEISHNGTYAFHKYDEFSTVLRFRGNVERFEDFSDTDRETAPRLIGTSKIKFTPDNNLAFAFEHELVGKYNSGFEGVILNDDNTRETPTYSGHNVFNFLVSYKYKKVELWLHALNLFDVNYANRVSYSTFSGNTYTVGNPRTFHLGAKYNF